MVDTPELFLFNGTIQVKQTVLWGWIRLPSRRESNDTSPTAKQCKGDVVQLF
jgi:hypothetical protein